MNIDELKSGRDLDSIIAEKVMGYEKICWSSELRGEKDGIFDIIPYFSTSISDAWLVFEKLKEIECQEDWAADITISFNNYHNKWMCAFIWHEAEYDQVLDESAPLVICKFALKIIGYKKRSNRD